MDKLETNFSTIQDFSEAPDWIIQQFNVSAEDGRGSYGKTFVTENVFYSPEVDDRQRDARNQGSVALRVGGHVATSDAISAAEIDSSRMDMLWGSYRATMKLSPVAGTCAAFFWVRSPSRVQQTIRPARGNTKD
jgi:hypothetical protein